MKDIRKISELISSLLAENGIEKAAYSASERETREFNCENGEFTLLRTLFDNNASVTVFKDEKTGTIAGNDFSNEAIEALVKGAIEAAEASTPEPCKDIAPYQGKEVFKGGVYDADDEKFFKRLQEFNKDIKEKYPKIRMMLMFGKHVKRHMLYANTNGTEFETIDGFYTFMAEFAGNDGEKTTGMNAGWVSCTDLDTPFIEQPSVKQGIEESIAQLNEVEMKGKFEGTVLFTPQCLGTFANFLVENFLSGGVILDGTSLWKDKLGEKVVDERITLIADSYNPKFVAGDRYTGDGFKAETLPIIENGVLKNFQLSLYIANKTGRQPSKNLGGDFSMKPGDVSYKDIIKGIKKGLVVGGFSGGNPSTNGEFSGVAKNSFLIEDGEIKGAVTETMINGNLEAMFNNVCAVSKETICDGDTQFPYLAVDGIVISGK